MKSEDVAKLRKTFASPTLISSALDKIDSLLLEYKSKKSDEQDINSIKSKL